VDDTVGLLRFEDRLLSSSIGVGAHRYWRRSDILSLTITITMAIAQAVTRVGNRKYLDKQFGRQKDTCLCEIDSELIDFLTSAASVFECRQNKREQTPSTPWTVTQPHLRYLQTRPSIWTASKTFSNVRGD
jgi:hypothetical protein